VGQKVYAIGNPGGTEFFGSFTSGMISAIDRPVPSANSSYDLPCIQHNAAINPGNSGGALVNEYGQVIGLNSSKISSTEYEGMGFAVPSETAVRVVSDLLKYGKVQRGVLDAKILQLNRRIAQYAGLDIASGILVSEVDRGGNAEKAGLKGGTEAVYYGNRTSIIYLGGDVITKIDGIKIASLADYYSALESKRPGDQIEVVVHRNRKDVKLKITLSE
jgi:S1-C subfamily serine protease